MPDRQAGAERGEIFRREALEYRARQRGPGDVVRVAPRWTTTAFYVLIAAFAAALIAGMVVEVDRYARGTVATDAEGRVVVLLPAGVAPEVAPGRPVDLGDETARVVSSHEDVLYPPEVERLYGVEVIAPSVAVVTSIDSADDASGVARVLIEREPAIVALVPGLKALFGDGDA